MSNLDPNVPNHIPREDPETSDLPELSPSQDPNHPVRMAFVDLHGEPGEQYDESAWLTKFYTFLLGWSCGVGWAANHSSRG